jgi:hypothetical protein
MLTFFLMVNTGVAVLCAVFYYLLYMFTFNTDLLFKVHIHGLSGYLAGEELLFTLGLERSVSKLYPSKLLLDLLFCYYLLIRSVILVFVLFFFTFTVVSSNVVDP